MAAASTVSINITNSANSKQPAPVKLLEKLVGDLELLVKSLLERAQQQPDGDQEVDSVIRDDNLDLQKFCAKLEFLLQFSLREKKNHRDETIGLSGVSLGSASSRRLEYWSMIQDVFKSSRSFDDAVKYVKSLSSDVKTNIGRARAFLRFCLQYHRLADAVQQLTMEDRIVGAWYNDKAVWFNEELKSRLIQLLYDLNDVNFDLIGKNNFELDTSWPSIQLMNNPKNNHGFHRTRRTSSVSTYSISQSTSIPNQNDKDLLLSDNHSLLLGSTPLQMDDDLIYANVVASLSSHHNNNNLNLHNSHSPTNQSILFETTKNESNSESYSVTNALVNELRDQLQSLNDQLSVKTRENTELNSCLVKQTNLSENLSNLLRASEEKNKQIEDSFTLQSAKIESLQNENDLLKKELESVKSELNSKITEEENLQKEVLAQTQAIVSLKQMCTEQERTIEELRTDMNTVKERANQIEDQESENNRIKVQLDQKEEENHVLNVQVEKLTSCLEEERKHAVYLTSELNEVKSFYKQVNEKNTSLINQLEMDNNEIKKRLVKLIKEKAELWKKADDLEYENLLKTSAMWIDDSNVSNCMGCNSGFSLLLRKHHCRICLKVFCYYCCNNWIEYNNNKLRACKKCYESRDSLNSLKMASIMGMPSPGGATKDEASVHLDEEDHDKNDEHLVKTLTAATAKKEPPPKEDDEDEDDDDDPDINFEVRPEKLTNSMPNSADQSAEDLFSNVYDNKDVAAAIRSAATSSHSDLGKEDEPTTTTTTSISDKLAQTSADDSSQGFKSITQSTNILRAINEKLKQKFSMRSAPVALASTPSSSTLVPKSGVSSTSTSPKPPLTSYFIPGDDSSTTNAQHTHCGDDSDAFAIVSQDEIDKIKS